MKKIWNAEEKLKIERALQAKGVKYIAGVDEVGRGPLAGPVVCAAVIMPLDEASIIVGVDDSKKLSAKKREELSEEDKTKLRAVVENLEAMLRTAETSQQSNDTDNATEQEEAEKKAKAEAEAKEKEEQNRRARFVFYTQNQEK